MTTLNRLSESPPANSREMRAYMAAILEITGLMSGQGFPLKLFMTNYATHLVPKAKFPHATLEIRLNGLHYVTEPGRRYFSSRLSIAPLVAGQSVTRREVIDMIRKIMSPAPLQGWQSFNIPSQYEEQV